MPNACATLVPDQLRLNGQERLVEQLQSDRSITFICLAAITATFVVDLSMPLGVAVGVLHVVPVFISLSSQRRSITLGTAVVGTILTIVGFIASPIGGELWKVIVKSSLGHLCNFDINCSLSLAKEAETTICRALHTK